MLTLTLRPESDVIRQLTPNSGSTNYTRVDEEGAGDGVSTYVWTNGQGWLRDLYGLPNHTTETETILAVRVYARHKAAGETGGYPLFIMGRTVLKTHGVEYNGEDSTLPWTYSLIHTEYKVNPQTGIAWTWDEIDALQVGWSSQWLHWMHPIGYWYRIDGHCTQVWVEVDYDKDIDVKIDVPAISVDIDLPEPSTPVYASNIKVPAISVGITASQPRLKVIGLYSPLPPMKVMSQHLASSPQSLTCSISFVGIPNIIAEDKASKDYFHHRADPKTVKAMINEIASGVAVSGEAVEAQEFGNGYAGLGEGDTYGYGQILPTMTEDRTLIKIAFKLRKVGSPTGDITYRIADSEFIGTLRSKVLGDASMLGSVSAWYEVTLDTPLVMLEGSRYVIWCEYSDGDSNNKVVVLKNSYSVKAGEYAVELLEVGDPVEWTDVDCAYRYRYKSDGIDCFEHCQAYEVVYDSEDDLLNSYKPGDAFRIYEGESRLSTINKLLNYTTCLKRVEDDGMIHIFTPTDIPNNYEYGLLESYQSYTSAVLSYGDKRRAQVFSPLRNGVVSGVRILVSSPSVPNTVGIIVEIRPTVWNGQYWVPDGNGTALCSTVVPKESIPKSISFLNVVFDTEATLIEGINYALFIYHSSDWPEYINLWLDSAGSYPRGTACYSTDGNNWNVSPGWDYAFEVLGYYNIEYSLEPGYHNFFAKSIRHSLVIPNKIVVHSLAEDYPQYTGSATSAESYALLPVSSFVKTRLESNAQAGLIAEAMIARLETDSQQGAARVPMNIAAEVYDYVKVTDSIEGDSRSGNMGWLRRYYKPGSDMQSSWRMTFGFGKINLKALRGTSPHLLAGRMRPQPPEPLNDDTIVRWGTIRSMLTETIPEAFERVWDGDEEEGYAGINDLVSEINDIHLYIQDMLSIIQQLVEGYRELTE